jgi:phosphoribosylaminoimidazole-succinocarboxamide synthase
VGGLLGASCHPAARRATLQVLNQTAAWWFENTTHIVQNAVISLPDPNVTVMKKCAVFPVEFVCRGYLTGARRAAARPALACRGLP